MRGSVSQVLKYWQQLRNCRRHIFSVKRAKNRSGESKRGECAGKRSLGDVVYSLVPFTLSKCISQMSFTLSVFIAAKTTAIQSNDMLPVTHAEASTAPSAEIDIKPDSTTNDDVKPPVVSAFVPFIVLISYCTYVQTKRHTLLC